MAKPSPRALRAELRAKPPSMRGPVLNQAPERVEGEGYTENLEENTRGRRRRQANAKRVEGDAKHVEGEGYIVGAPGCSGLC